VGCVSAAKPHQAVPVRVHLQQRRAPVLGIVEPAMRIDIMSTMHDKHLSSGIAAVDMARRLGQCQHRIGRHRLRYCFAVCRNVESCSACVCTRLIATARERIRRTRSRSRCRRRRTPATPATPPGRIRRPRPARCALRKQPWQGEHLGVHGRAPR